MIDVKNQDHRFAKAKVVYEDINNHDRIIHQEIISGPVNSKVDREDYRDRIPVDYQFAGYGNFHTHLNDGDMNIIYVKSASAASRQPVKGLVKIDYVDDHNQLVKHRSLVGQLGTVFHLHTQVRNVPQGYQFKCILVGGNVTSFSRDTQIVVVALKRIQIKSRIVIEYICDGHQIGKSIAKGIAGNRFRIAPYRHQLPDHTHFVKFIDKVPKKFANHDVTIRLQVAKSVPAKSAQHQKSAVSDHAANQSAKAQMSAGDAQNLGQVLSKIGTSLNSLGKIIQNQDRHQRK